MLGVQSNFLNLVLSGELCRTQCNSTSEWLLVWKAEQKRFATNDPWLAAVSAAMQADRLAWAFFSGYQGAIQSAFPGHASVGHAGAFCVNESHRKISEITTTLTANDGGLTLSGSKAWVLAEFQELDLFVLAKKAGGPEAGPGSMSVVHLSIDSPGVSHGDVRPQPMVPEIPHSSIEFNAVRLEPEQVIDGDGYADFAKPFRLREDLFVTSCALAYLLGEAKSGKWPTAWIQRCISVMSMMHQCTELDPKEVKTHILVAGALSFSGEVIRESEELWTLHQTDERNRWHRDKPILELGKDARRQRAMTSWATVGWK